MPADLAALDSLFFQNIYHRQRVLIALRDFLCFPFFLCLLIFDQVGIGPAGPLCGRDIQPGKVLPAYFKRNTGKRRKVAIACRVNIHFCLHLHVTALGIEDQKINVLFILHLNRDESRVVKNADTVFQTHILKHNLSIFRFERWISIIIFARINLPKLPCGIQPFGKFKTDAFDIARDLRHISIGSKSAERGAFFKQHGMLSMARSFNRCRNTSGAAADNSYFTEKRFAEIVDLHFFLLLISTRSNDSFPLYCISILRRFQPKAGTQLRRRRWKVTIKKIVPLTRKAG